MCQFLSSFATQLVPYAAWVCWLRCTVHTTVLRACEQNTRWFKSRFECQLLVSRQLFSGCSQKFEKPVWTVFMLEHEFPFVVAAVAQPSGHHRLMFRPAFAPASLLLAHPGYYSVCSTPHTAAQAAQDTHQDTHVGAAQKVS